MASVRLAAPSLTRIAETCFEAVRRLMKRASEIWRSVHPCARSANTSCSRALRARSGSDESPGSGAVDTITVASRNASSIDQTYLKVKLLRQPVAARPYGREGAWAR